MSDFECDDVKCKGLTLETRPICSLDCCNPEAPRMKEHIPGYSGFVPKSRFLVGANYTSITRTALMMFHDNLREHKAEQCREQKKANCHIDQRPAYPVLACKPTCDQNIPAGTHQLSAPTCIAQGQIPGYGGHNPGSRMQGSYARENPSSSSYGCGSMKDRTKCREKINAKNPGCDVQAKPRLLQPNKDFCCYTSSCSK